MWGSLSVVKSVVLAVSEIFTKCENDYKIKLKLKKKRMGPKVSTQEEKERRLLFEAMENNIAK